MSFLQRPVTRDEQLTYAQDGVVCLRGAINLRTVNMIREAINTSVRTAAESTAAYDFSTLAKAIDEEDWEALRKASNGQHDVVGIAQYMQSTGKPLLRDASNDGTSGRFFVDTGSAARIKDFRRTITTGALPEIAASLLGGDQIRLVDDQVFVKAPSTAERTAFHQDANYMSMDGDQCCVLWIAVDETSLETGTMQYIRGSHRNGKLYKPNVFLSQAVLPGSEGEDLPDIEANPNDFDIVHFDTQPGDILVHHYKTVHGTGGNQSPLVPRRAASIRYGGDDLRFANRPYAPVRPHHVVEQSNGEPLNDTDFPIVWQRSQENQAA